MGMKDTKPQSAGAICKKLFRGTGQINYYMLYKAIEESGKERNSDNNNEMTR